MSEVKTRTKIFIPKQICSRCVSKFKLKLYFHQCFSDLDASGKEIFVFKKPFKFAIKALPPNLQLEVINLQCSDTLKDKYQKNVVKVYKCLPSNEFAPLESCLWINISI